MSCFLLIHLRFLCQIIPAYFIQTYHWLVPIVLISSLRRASRRYMGGRHRLLLLALPRAAMARCTAGFGPAVRCVRLGVCERQHIGINVPSDDQQSEPPGVSEPYT
jgi:hypothetical protein